MWNKYILFESNKSEYMKICKHYTNSTDPEGSNTKL